MSAYTILKDRLTVLVLHQSDTHIVGGRFGERAVGQVNTQSKVEYDSLLASGWNLTLGVDA